MPAPIAVDPALLLAGVGLLVFALIVSRRSGSPRRRPRISRRVMPLYRSRRQEDEDPGAPERRRQYREMRSLRREF